MKFKLIALSLCMIASANVVKGQEIWKGCFHDRKQARDPSVCQ